MYTHTHIHTIHLYQIIPYTVTAIRVSSWLGQKATESGVVSKEMVFTHLPVDTSQNFRLLSFDPSKVISTIIAHK